MSDKPTKSNPQDDPRSARKGVVKKTREGSGNLFKRWKEPGKNKMGNDISSEIKIANSNGTREGGEDKRWHMPEGE